MHEAIRMDKDTLQSHYIQKFTSTHTHTHTHTHLHTAISLPGLSQGYLPPEHWLRSPSPCLVGIHLLCRLLYQGGVSDRRQSSALRSA